MNITRELIAEMTIEAFAAQHQLTMKVVERSRDFRGVGNRFYACFDRAEVKDGPVLKGEYGNGDTEDAAIAEYADRISERLLVVNAYSHERREIRVPRLVYGAE